MSFPEPAVAETSDGYMAPKTRAKCWTLSRADKTEDEDLDEDNFVPKLSVIESALQTSSSFCLITACGDPNKPGCPVQISNDRRRASNFDALNRLLGVESHSYGLYRTLRPRCSYVSEYDTSLQNLQAITILVRFPINTRAIVCVMKIQVSTLSGVAFVCCTRQDDIDAIRRLCGANQALLRANPLGLLSILYDFRAQYWEDWVTRLFLEVNRTERLTKSSPPDWLAKEPPLNQYMPTNPILMPTMAEYLNMTPINPALGTHGALTPDMFGFAPVSMPELTDIDTLLSRLYTTDTEISHGQNVMSYAARYANFCLDVVNVMDLSRQSIGKPPQAPGARAMVEGRIRFTQSRCHAVQDRFAEMRERHRSQIDASFSLIRQRETKISSDVARLVASDSRTMKTIGVLTLVFLPATLVTSLWQANVFQLDDDINGKVFLGTTIAVTVFVFFIWRIYMHISQKDLYFYTTVARR